jgi:alpha-L-fucosidase
MVLRRTWSRWRDALAIVRPETVVGWHRAGFRLYWRWKSRPWKAFGEGPVASAPPSAGGRGAGFNERNRQDFTAGEIRFTTKGSNLYAFVMAWPEKEAVVKALSTNSSVTPFKVKKVDLLGFKGMLKWTEDEKGLAVQMPAQKPCDHAVTLKVSGA